MTTDDRDPRILTQPWAEERLITGLPDSDYHGTFALSSSLLCAALESPAHFRHIAKYGKKQTPAMKFGKVAHKAILEGPEFLSRYVVMPEFSGKGSRAEKSGWLADQSSSAIIVTQDELDQITGMLNALLAHDMAKRLWEGEGKNKELSGFFNFEGFRCKFRADIFRSDGILVDFKSANDGSLDGFHKAAWSQMYPVQAAWYLNAASLLTKKDYRIFSYIVVETKPPHAVTVRPADDSFISAGEIMYSCAIRRLRKCLDSGKWPAYAEQAVNVGIPHYATFQLEEYENEQ